MPPVVVAVAAGVAAGVAAASVVVGVAVAIGTVALSVAMKPEMPKGLSEDIERAQTLSTGSIIPRRGVYGETVVSGAIVGYGKRKEGYGDSAKEFHVVAVAIAGHHSESLSLYRVNDKEPPEGTLFRAYLGDQDTVDPILRQIVTGWTDNHIGRGVTYALVQLPIDQEKLPQGLRNITFKIKGKKVYDPRKDSSIGGNGTHRHDNPATWEWSDNPVLCAFDFLRFQGYRQQPISRFDLADIAAEANVCDELVNIDKGGATVAEKRFTCNGSWTYDEGPAEVLQRILTSCAGKPYRRGGKIYIKPASYHGPAVLEITTADLAGRVKYRPNTSERERCNVVRATYIDPEAGYITSESPVLRVDEYVTADGAVREHEIRLPFTSSNTMAQRLQKYYLERNRAGFVVEATVGPKGLLAEPGKAVALNLADDGIVGEFIVADWSYDQTKKTVSLVLIIEQPELYGDEIHRAVSRPIFNVPDNTTVEPPQQVSFAGESSGRDFNGLLTWQHPAPATVEAYIVRVYSDPSTQTQGDEALIIEQRIEGTRLREYAVRDLPAGDYVMDVSAVSKHGKETMPARIFVPIYPPAAPTGINVAGGNFELTVAPIASNLSYSSAFEFDILVGLTIPAGYTPTPKARGITAIFTGLQPNSDYTIFARTVSPYGVSGWINTSARTVLNESQLAPFIADIRAEIERINAEDLTLLRNDLTAAQNEIDAIVAPDLTPINNEIARVEGLVGTLQTDVNSRLNTLSQDLQTLDGGLSQLEVQSANNAQQLTTTQQNLSALSGDLSALEGELSTLSAGISARFPIKTIDIQDGAISAAKIAAAAIEAGKLAAAAVTADKIAALAVNADKIASNAITTTKIADGAIASAKIASGAVDAAKLNIQVGGGNLVTDSSFEAEPATWFTYNNYGNASTRFDTGRNGGRCRVTIAGTTAGGTLGTYKVAAIKGGWQKEVPYVVSFYAKKQNGANMTGCSLEWDNGPQYTTTLKNPSLSTEWQRYAFLISWSKTSNQPNANGYGILWINAQGSWITGDEIWLDDVQVEQADVLTAYAPMVNEILPGTITATQISDEAITTPKLVAGAVAAGKIAVSAVSANELAANAVVADKIASNAITAAKISSGAVTAGKIAAGAVTANEIAANAITAAKIATGAVTAGKIAAGTITATEIAAGAIEAAKIAAGAIQADKIAAGAITASKLRVTGGGAINYDPMFADSDAWGSDFGSFSFVELSDAPAGRTVLRSNSGGAAYPHDLAHYPIDTAKRYRVRFFARSVGANGFIYFCLRQYSAPGVPCSNNSGRAPYKPAGVSVPTSWTEYSVEYGSGDWQAGVKFVKLDWLLNYQGSAGYMEICFPRFEEMSDADLIVDGAIIASKIATNAVTADKIEANAVTAAKIAAGAVTATQISAGAVTAGKITAGAVTATEIATNAITSAKISAGAVTATQIASNAVTADKISAGAVTAGKIAANAVTANEIAARSITAAKLVISNRGAALNDSPNFDDLSAWWLQSGISQAGGAGGAAVAPTYITAYSGTDLIANSERAYPIDPNKVYSLTAMVYAPTANNRHMYLFVEFYDSSNNYVGSSATGWGGAKSGYTYGAAPNLGDWQRVGGQFGRNTGRPIPGYVKQVRIGVWFQYSGVGSSQVQQACQDLRLEEVIDTGLIVDGAIIASKISAGAVTAGAIAANAVTAGAIAANAVTADKITSNAVTAAKIATGAVSADKIAANAVTADKIAANAITAAKIAAGTITADKVATNFLRSAFVSTGGLDVTEGNNRVRIRPDNQTPILFEVNGVPTFSVNIDGTGYFKGKLAENTVDATALSDEAKKAVNPYYLGGGEKYGTSGTAVRMATGAVVDIGTFTTLTAGDRVAIAFRFQEAVEWIEGMSSGSEPSYTTSSYTITLQRRLGSTGSFLNISGAINLTITPYNWGGFTPPGEPYNPIVTGYSYDVNQQFTDVLPSTNNHVTYRLVVTRTSGSGTTAQGLLRRQFIGEKAAYKLNEIRGTTVKQWIDKETGFTIISGSVSRLGVGSDFVSFPTALAEVYSCTLGYNRNTEASGNRYPPRYRNLSTTGVTIDSIDGDTRVANVTSYQVTGRVAV